MLNKKAKIEWKTNGLDQREKMINRLWTAVEWEWINEFDWAPSRGDANQTIFWFDADRKTFYALVGFTKDITKKSKRCFGRAVKH